MLLNDLINPRRAQVSRPFSPGMAEDFALPASDEGKFFAARPHTGFEGDDVVQIVKGLVAGDSVVADARRQVGAGVKIRPIAVR